MQASLMFPTVNAQEKEKDKGGYVQKLEENLLEVHSIARGTLRESQKDKNGILIYGFRT